MINKKISTIAGSLVIIAIATAIGFVFLSNKEKGAQNQNNVVLDNLELGNKEKVKQGEENVIGDIQAKKDEAVSEQENKIDTSYWKVCKNEKANYEFKYPSDWLIVNRYLTVFKNCSNASNPRGTGFSIGPDRYGTSNKSFSINTSTQKDLEVTIYKGATSLDEYYSRNDKLLSSNMKLKEATLLGERADWTQNENMIYIKFFHNSILYEIDSNIEDQKLLETVLNTLKFPNN